MARAQGTPKTGGRKAGTVNKLTAAVKEMVIQALDELGGVAYLKLQARENPTAFLSLVGKIIPTQISGDPDNPLVTIKRIERVIVGANQFDGVSATGGSHSGTKPTEH
jgi:hypothetical protein